MSSQAAKQEKIRAMYMRGGTSKGVFFVRNELPKRAQQEGSYRDQLLLRVIGSPDPYAKQMDGMGGASSSTSKAVIVSKSERTDHDIDYLFAQVAIDKAFVDYSGNCGNLSAAVGIFAIENGLIDKQKLPKDGIYKVKIWQQNIAKTIVAHLPIKNYEIVETGDFELDGVSFPSAEIKLDFIDPSGSSHDQEESTNKDENTLLPTGRLIDTLSVPNIGDFRVSYINAGIPTVFLSAQELGLSGYELQDEINNNAHLLAKFETIRAYAAIQMGLINHVEEAKQRQHTPKIAFVSPPQDYITSSQKEVKKSAMDLHVRALSMGKLHHAMMGTAAVAIACAAAVKGSVVNQAAGGQSKATVCFAHPSGVLSVGAELEQNNGRWIVNKVSMSRSARILMEGKLRIPNLNV